MKLEEISSYYNVHDEEELKNLKQKLKLLYDSVDIDCSFVEPNWRVSIYKDIEEIRETKIDLSEIKSISIKPKRLKNIRINYHKSRIFINCDRENFNLNLDFAEEKK
jgi:hypothetical protein